MQDYVEYVPKETFYPPLDRDVRSDCSGYKTIAPIVMAPHISQTPWQGTVKPSFYISPIDRNNNMTYVGKVFSLPPESKSLTDAAGCTSRHGFCPVTMCSCCSGPDCKCNKPKNPWHHRYWKYDFNWY